MSNRGEERTSGATLPPSARRARAPFRFWTSFVLQEATGLRAATLSQLLSVLQKVPEASIYYHTHYFLLTHHYLRPEPTNEFAYWVREVLGDRRLGELLTSIDTMDYATLESLRQALVKTIDDYRQREPAARLKFASEGEEFFFAKCVHVLLPTPYQAATLDEFAEALSRVSVHSLYYHAFEARLRIGRRTNDFAVWIDEALGLKELAETVARLDPYVHTLDTLRASLLALIQHTRTASGASHASVG